MMRTVIASIVVAACILIASESKAQVVVGGTPWGYSQVVVGGPYTGAFSGSFVPPYSYYAAYPHGYWPRSYVGYGANDIFPFYGKPYGHPSDAWTWPYMSVPPWGGALNRYYYPPLG
jgi:hypothetical protein